MVIRSHIILYVRNQDESTAFYTLVLGMKPHLYVPGMTEFQLSANIILGLMPESGIKRLLGAALPDPSLAAGIPRAELYLVVDDPLTYHQRALKAGGRELSGLQDRDWGDQVSYSLDPDGHVLAFATPIQKAG